MIEKKISHSYVEKYIQKPLIDFDKLSILHYLYKDLNIATNRKQHYVITIMLVQIALDTHELLPSNGSREMGLTEKQLSVLAGDYYSGLYYLLLSEIEDIEMIQVLATAIQKINEQKMVLFYKNLHSIDELLITLKNIESILFTEVALFLDSNYELIPVIKEVLLINRLYREKELLKENKFSHIREFIKKEKNESYFDTEMEQLIENREQILDRLLLSLPDQYSSFRNTIRNKIKLSFNITVAEEG